MVFGSVKRAEGYYQLSRMAVTKKTVLLKTGGVCRGRARFGLETKVNYASICRISRHWMGEDKGTMSRVREGDVRDV